MTPQPSGTRIPRCTAGRSPTMPSQGRTWSAAKLKETIRATLYTEPKLTDE